MSFHSLCTVIESTKCFLFPSQKLSVSGSMQTELLQNQVDGKLYWHPLISSCSHTLFPMFHYRTVPRGLAMTHYVHQPIELPCKEDLSEHIGFSLNSSVSRTRKLWLANYVALHCSTCMYGSKVRVKAWVERLKRPPTENAKIFLMTQKDPYKGFHKDMIRNISLK